MQVKGCACMTSLMPHTSPFAGRADLSSLWPQPLAPGLQPPPELALPNDRGDGWQAGRQRLRSAAALRLPVAVMLRNPEPLWLQRPVRAAEATDGATRRDSIEPVSESQAIAHHPGGSWHSGSLRLTRSEFCVQWPSRFPASCAAVEAGSSGRARAAWACCVQYIGDCPAIHSGGLV